MPLLAIDEEMKDEIVVVQRVDTTIPEIKDFIKHSDNEEDVSIPKSTKNASVAKASARKKAPSVRKESPPK